MLILNNQPECYSGREPALVVIYAFLLMPVFSNYIFIGPISIGDVFFVLVFPWLCLHFKYNAINIFQLLLCLVLVVISLYVYASTDTNDYLWQMLRTSFYFISFYIISGQNYLSYQRFFKHYAYVGMFFSAAIILQWAGYHIFKISVPLQLPLPFYEPDTLTQISHVYRSGGFFKEPSYFSIFVTPLFFYLVIERRYLFSIILIFAGVMSTSTLFLFIFLASFIFLPWRITLIIMCVCIFVFFVAINFLDGVANHLIILSRFASVFIDGGTLNERFFPIINILSSSDFFYSEESVHYLKTSGFWFSSLGSIMSMLGFTCVVLIILSFYRYGFILGSVLVIYMFTTHYMSGVYSSFVFFATHQIYLLLKEKKYEYKECIS